MGPVKKAAALVLCLASFGLVLAVLSVVIVVAGGGRHYVLQALLKPALSAFAAVFLVEKAFQPDHRLHYYVLTAGAALFSVYLSLGRPDALTFYHLLASASYVAATAGAGYAAIRLSRSAAPHA